MQQIVNRTLKTIFRSIPRYNRQLVHTTSIFYQYDSSNSKDISTIIELESTLFENSSHKSSPVNTEKLLKEYNLKAKQKRNSRKTRPERTKVQPKPTVEPIEEETANQPTVIKTKIKSDLIHNKELDLSFIKLNMRDPILQTLLLSAKSRKRREQKHQLLVEGRRIIIDALSSGLELEYLLFSDIDQLKLVKDHLQKTTKLIKVPQADLKFWSNLSTCPGLIGIFIKPVDMKHIWKETNTLPITVICDQIREPNNIGSVIRNCAAIPCTQVIVTKGCADPWESKALRGAAGTQFAIPIVGPMEWSSVMSFLPEEFSFYIAENKEENAVKYIPDNMLQDPRQDLIVSYMDMSFRDEHCVIVIGGETTGVSSEAYDFLKQCAFGKCINIPLAKGIDSLNTASALAVLLFEYKKQVLLRNKNSKVAIEGIASLY